MITLIVTGKQSNASNRFHKLQKDIGESLSEQHEDQKRENRMYLIKVLSTIKYLARQGIAFRGDKDDSDSNFVQLLKLRSSDDPRIQTWMKRTKDFTSPELQNEFLKVMSNDILRKQIKQIQQAQFFTIMADETVDSSNKEQLVICLRWVDVDFEPHENFVGMYHIDNTEASTILNAIEDLIYLLIAYLVSVMTWQHLWLGQNLELHLVSNQLKSVQFICIVTAMHSILLVMMQ